MADAVDASATLEATITSFVGAFPTDYAPKSKCSNLSSNSIVGLDFASSCLPEDFNPDPTAYYSPGTECPTGYTAQRSCTRSSGETSTVTCCPVRGDLTMWCVEDPETLSGAWESMFCTWSAGSKETVLLVTIDSTSIPAVTMSGADGVNAYGLRMVYESSDLSTSTSKAKTKAETTTHAETTSAETTSTVPAESHNDTLSTGSKAAIGVVIPLFLIALALGIFFFLRKRKQKQKQAYGTVETNELHAESKTPAGELNGDMSYGSYMSPQELPTETHLSELPSNSPAYAHNALGSEYSAPGSTASPHGGYSVSSEGPSQAGASWGGSHTQGHGPFRS